jgi:hypothetical protein
MKSMLLADEVSTYDHNHLIDKVRNKQKHEVRIQKIAEEAKIFGDLSDSNSNKTGVSGMVAVKKQPA